MQFGLARNSRTKEQLHRLQNDYLACGSLVKTIERRDWASMRANAKAADSSLFSSLLKMGSSLQSYSEHEDDQAWLVGAITRTSITIQEHGNDMSALAEKTLAEIIKSVSAMQGVIYAREIEDDGRTILKKVAGYACSRNESKFLEVESGQGLVGECYQRGEKIFLNTVPKDFLVIKSGLGESAPGYAFLFPLQHNEITEGVLEIASFANLTDVQLKFTEQIASLLASTFRLIREHKRTEQLLAKSEQITIELKQKELEIEKIRKREKDLIESKLKTQQDLNDRIVEKLRSKIFELEEKIKELLHPVTI